jgi:hypothetical protein
MSQEINPGQDRSGNQQFADERLKALGALAGGQFSSSTGIMESGRQDERRSDRLRLGLHIASIIHECGGQAIMKKADQEDLVPDVLGNPRTKRRIGFHVSLTEIDPGIVHMKTLAGQQEGPNRVDFAIWLSTDADRLVQCEVPVLALLPGSNPRQSAVRYGTLRQGKTAIGEAPLHEVITRIMTGDLGLWRLQRRFLREHTNTVRLQHQDRGWWVFSSAEEYAQRQEREKLYDEVVERRNRMKNVEREQACREELCKQAFVYDCAALDCARLIKGSGQAPVVRLEETPQPDARIQFEVAPRPYAHIHFDGVDFLMVSHLQDVLGGQTTRRVREILAEHPTWYWVDQSPIALEAGVYNALTSDAALAARHIGFQEAKEVLEGTRVLETDLRPQAALKGRHEPSSLGLE